MDEPKLQQPAQPPRFKYEDRLVRIGTDPDELRQLADAIVRGASIKYARIADLRAIVEAVMTHEGATLAPVQDAAAKERREWNGLTKLQREALTKIFVHRSLIEHSGAKFSNFDILCTLSCGDTAFRGYAEFANAAFHGSAAFFSVIFRGGAGFGNAAFHGDARFEDAEFYTNTWFSIATFHDDARFDGAAFCTPARFDHAVFRSLVGFDDTVFHASAWFDYTVFRGGAWFEGAAFHKDASGDLRRADLRVCSFAEAATILEPTPSEEPSTTNLGEESFSQSNVERIRTIAHHMRDCWMRLRRGPIRKINHWFGWHRVRSFGELAILNRISLFALIAVPILAAIWPLADRMARHFVNTDDRLLTLGNSLVLTFLAAVFVTLGRLLYQVAAPPIIQRFDEDAFVDDLMQRYAKDEGSLREDGLRRATEALARIASVRPDRHANLVSHHGETVWIPPKEHIEWFNDEDEPQTEPAAAADAETADADEQPAEPKPKRLPTNQLPGYLPGEERARIALEEGARAEYWLKARNVKEIDRGTTAGGRALLDPKKSERVAAKPPWLALLSFALYWAGLFALLAVLLIQVDAVMRAAGWLGQ